MSILEALSDKRPIKLIWPLSAVELNGLFERASADLDDLINASTSGHLAHRYMPRRRLNIINDVVSSCSFERFSFLVAGSRRNDPRAEQLGKLESEEREPPDPKVSTVSPG